MTGHGRKYGDRESRPIPLWNGVLEPRHRKKIGPAIWEFLWCVDRITREENNEGIVLGGAPMTAGKIASDLGEHSNSVRRHMDRLEKYAYILRTRAPYGHVIRVRNSRKFGIWKASARVTNSGEPPSPRDSQVLASQIHQSCVPDSTELRNVIKTQQDAARNAAASRPAAVWKETGIDPNNLPGPFRKHCEEHWATCEEESLFDAMGHVLDAWRALGNLKYPPAWVKRKAEIGHSTHLMQGPERPELESIPWQK